MHKQFNWILQSFSYDTRFIELLKANLLHKINELAKETGKKFQRIYEKFSPKYREEVNTTERLMRDTCVDLSNQ